MGEGIVERVFERLNVVNDVAVVHGPLAQFVGVDLVQLVAHQVQRVNHLVHCRLRLAYEVAELKEWALVKGPPRSHLVAAVVYDDERSAGQLGGSELGKGRRVVVCGLLRGHCPLHGAVNGSLDTIDVENNFLH